MRISMTNDGKIRVFLTDRGQSLDELSPVIQQILSNESVKKALLESKTIFIKKAGVSEGIKNSSQTGWEYGLSSFGFLLPNESREDWIGNFLEALNEMHSNGSPRWKRCGIALGWVCLLLIAALRIRISDLLPGVKNKHS